METKNRIKIKELARLSGVNYHRVFAALSFGSAVKLSEEERQSIKNVLPTLKSEVITEIDNLNTFFS